MEAVNAVWAAVGLEDHTRLIVLLALADWSNKDGESWYGIPKIAQKARMSERNCRYVLRKLEAEGILYIEASRGGRGLSNLYRINYEALSKLPSKSGQPSGDTQPGNPANQTDNPANHLAGLIVSETLQKSGETLQTGAETLQNDTQNPAKLVAGNTILTITDTPVETSGDSKGKKPKSEPSKVPIPVTLQTVDFHRAWHAFLIHRAAFKQKPFTDHAAELILRELMGKPVEMAIAMLEQSIKRGWAGVFPVKDFNQTNVTNENHNRNTQFNGGRGPTPAQQRNAEIQGAEQIRERIRAEAANPKAPPWAGGLQSGIQEGSAAA